MKDKPDVLADELVSMANADQAMRNANIEGGSWDASIDKANTNRLKEIIATDGWPTISEVGHNAALAAWLIAQHADHDPVFQARCLELMKQLPTDEIILANLAYLEDRVRVSRGQPQLYGTQFDDTQSFGPKLVEDEEHLDERRASVGLGSSSEYKQRMEELYKPQGK